ncbi:MAG: DUF3617 domain-containing protein [Stenotrophobium sp.]
MISLRLRGIHKLCALALIVTPALALAEPGYMMQMNTTVKMEMPGMPSGNMPAQTHSSKICTSVKKPDMSKVMHGNKDCVISDYEKVGDTISYHMTCSGHMHMQGDARMQMKADGGMHGHMHMIGTSPSPKMDMDMTFDGTRIGSCDYTPPQS